MLSENLYILSLGFLQNTLWTLLQLEHRDDKAHFPWAALDGLRFLCTQHILLVIVTKSPIYDTALFLRLCVLLRPFFTINCCSITRYRWPLQKLFTHYSDIIMGAIAYPITSLTTAYSTDIQAQIKENIKAPRHWPFVRGFHRWPVNSRTNGQ